MQKAVNVMRIWFYLAFSSWGLLKSLVCLVVTIIGSNLNVCEESVSREGRPGTFVLKPRTNYVFISPYSSS